MAASRHERRNHNTIQDIGLPAAETGAQAALLGTDAIRQSADTMQQIMRAGLGLARQISEHSADHLALMFGLTGNGADQSTRNVEAIMSPSTVVAQTLQNMSREWFDFSRRRVEYNLEKISALINCRTPQDFVAAHSDLLRDHVESLMQNDWKLAQMSLRMAEESGRKMTERTHPAG